MGNDCPEGELFHEIKNGNKNSKLSKNGKRILGIFLLLIVNVVWVSSAELTRYLFIDLHFKRPFFTTYVKSCMFTMFMIKACMNANNDGEPKNGSNKYSKLEDKNAQSENDEYEDSSDETTSFEIESLTPAEFEPVVLPSDSEVDRPPSPTVSISLFDDDDNSIDGFGPFTEKDKFSPPLRKEKKSLKTKIKEKTKKVKFAMFREVRKIPASIAFEARLARLSFQKTEGICEGCFDKSSFLGYMFMFAPLWFISSTTYQAALCFDNVSFVTLISSSSSLFVLIFGAINPKRIQDKFSWKKLFYVSLNLFGVFLVSELTGTGYGLLFSLISAVSYAGFLQTFSSMTGSNGKVDRFLMFGTIGVFSVFACTPLILIAHATKLESQLPWPTREEFFLVVINGLIGSIFADYLWIWATELTSSLVSSLSLTLSIPLSFVADALFRNQLPSSIEIIASLPIMASFIGASLLQNQKTSKTKKMSKKLKNEFNEEKCEMKNLISDDYDDQL